MKKSRITLLLLLVTIFIITSAVVFYLRFNLYFPEINGKVIDENGEPIPEQKVIVNYRCPQFCINIVGSCDSRKLGYRETYTDEKGNFNFNDLNYGLNFYTDCGIQIESGCEYSYPDCEGNYSVRYYYYKKQEVKNELITLTLKLINRKLLPKWHPNYPSYSKALEEGDYKICSDMKDNAGSDDIRCISAVAVKNKDISICKNIEPQHLRVRWCQYPTAIAMGDIKYCDYIEWKNERKACEIYYT